MKGLGDESMANRLSTAWTTCLARGELYFDDLNVSHVSVYIKRELVISRVLASCKYDVARHHTKQPASQSFYTAADGA